MPPALAFLFTRLPATPDELEARKQAAPSVWCIRNFFVSLFHAVSTAISKGKILRPSSDHFAMLSFAEKYIFDKNKLI